MKLIKEESVEKQFVISLSESELGTILVSLGNMSNDEVINHRDNEYPSSLKILKDNYEFYKQIKIMLGIST